MRRLLAGTENILDGLLDDLQEIAHGGDFAFQVVSGALKVVPFLSGPPRSEPDSESAIIAKSVETLRDECTKALRPPRKYEASTFWLCSQYYEQQTKGFSRLQGVLYALLVSHTTLVTLLRPKDHSIHPADLHILLSTIGNTDALRTPNAESWIPICMPRFNSRGFLHAFICYCNRETKVAMQQAAVSSPEEAESKGDLGLGIILITADKEGFFDMKQWKDHAFAKLFREQASYGNSAASNGHLSLYERLRYAITPWPKADVIASGEGRASKDWMLAGSGSSIPHIPPMRHFWYKSKTHVQIFSPSSHLSALATSESAGSPIGSHASRYLHIRETLHNSINRARGDGGAKLVYSVGPDEAILGLVNLST